MTPARFAHNCAMTLLRVRFSGRRLHRTGVAALLWLSGCADLAVDRIRPGQRPQEYEGTLPAASTRRTDLGLACLEQSPTGRIDAIVLMLTSDRRVAGKLHATHWSAGGGLPPQPAYRLRVQVDPVLASVQGAGPIDTLRMLAGDLACYEGERLARDAHAWVAGGLVRLLQRWPGVTDFGVAETRMSQLNDLVPAGGEARMIVDRDGQYRFEYELGNVPRF
jgi:hypothetical protein